MFLRYSFVCLSVGIDFYFISKLTYLRCFHADCQAIMGIHKEE